MNTKDLPWNSEPPLCAGWYIASSERGTGVQRYWDGIAWSAPCYWDDTVERVVRARNTRAESQAGIEWQCAVVPPGRDPHQCACKPGSCIATPAGVERGHVSAISDIRCVAAGLGIIPPPAAPGYVRGESVPGMVARATAALPALTAVDMLNAAAKHIADRAAAYDKPQGERSMAQTVVAFNAVTGHSITESQGWFFMECLKAVRDFTTAGGHADSQEDRTAYSALGAEARRAGR